jgi:hypothetical protein
MGKIKLNFGVLAALAVIVLSIYLAFNAVQTQSYSGSELDITTSGVIKLDNPGDEPVTMRATSRTTFTLDTSDTETATIRATRDGSVRPAVYFIEAEIPPGQTTLSVTRGSDVTFDLNGSAPLAATVAARSDSGNRDIILYAAAVCIAAVVYMSFATQHGWFKLLRSRLFNRGAASADMTASPA